MGIGSGQSGFGVEGGEGRLGRGPMLRGTVWLAVVLLMPSLPVLTFLAPATAVARTVHTGRHWHGSAARPGQVRRGRLSALASTSGGVSAAAAQSGEAELPGLRTQYSRTFAEADGSRRLVSSAAPMNYRDARGAWQFIDDSLVGDCRNFGVNGPTRPA